MNWQTLMFFLRKVVPAGEQETEELIKLYEYAKQQAEKAA